MDDFLGTSAVEVARLVRSGDSSAREQTQRALDAIAARNDELGAFVALDPERALAEAAAVDARLASGEQVGPLAGVPIGVKDLEDAIGHTTSHGSLLHAQDPPATSDSALVERLRAAGCVVVGKTNTPEFGHKGDTINDVFGATRNPHNIERSAGGSSGGSAAALAAGMVPLATGSDGGGSIRIPAALCGLSGFKPSRGRIPMTGEESSAWLHYSTPSPMARRVADIAYALDVTVGPDPADLNSLPAPRGESWYDGLEEAGSPRAVLWSPNLGYGANDTEVESVCRAAIERIANAGVEVIEVDEVFDHDPIRDWAAVAFIGLRAKLRPYRDTPDLERFSASLRQLAEVVAQADKYTVYDALQAGHRLNLRLVELFHRAPLLLCPTIAGQAGTPGREGTVNGKESPSWVTYTPPFNMTGNPVGTVNAGLTAERMPVGLQIIGPQHGDVAVLRAMSAFERII